MQVVPGLRLVEGMPFGMVHAYVWERPDGGLTLIDAGMPNAGKAILAFLGDLGPERMDRIIVTHGDIDHVGGLATVVRATGARVVCHAVEKALLEQTTRRKPRRSLLGALYYPLFLTATKTLLRYPPVTPDQLVLDKEVLPEGFQVIHVPGHTAGQIALYEPQRGILLAADALTNFGNRLAGPPALFTPQVEAARDSVRKLAGLPDVQVICFGHGPPITSGAAERIRAFAATLQ